MNPLDLLSHFAPNRIAEREINRLLHEQPQARERLKRFAGKTARFALGPLQFGFLVRSDGSVEASQQPENGQVAVAPDLFIRGSLEAVSAMLRSGDTQSTAERLQAAMAHVNIEGNIGFAQEIAFLAEHLRFEPEERLAQGLRRVLPMAPTHALDALAMQTVSGGKRFVRWGAEAGQRLSESAAEYLVHENPTLINREALRDFTLQVESLSNRIERTLKRVQHLQKNTAQ